jgi:hypothetical protein
MTPEQPRRNVMKKLLCLALIVTGCGSYQADHDATKRSSTADATARDDRATSGLSLRMPAFKDASRIAKVRATLTNLEDGRATRQEAAYAPGTEMLFDDLRVGAYAIEVAALGRSGSVVMIGHGEVLVTEGELAVARISLHHAEDDGTGGVIVVIDELPSHGPVEPCYAPTPVPSKPAEPVEAPEASPVEDREASKPVEASKPEVDASAPTAKLSLTSAASERKEDGDVESPQSPCGYPPESADGGDSSGGYAGSDGTAAGGDWADGSYDGRVDSGVGTAGGADGEEAVDDKPAAAKSK